MKLPFLALQAAGIDIGKPTRFNRSTLEPFQSSTRRMLAHMHLSQFFNPNGAVNQQGITEQMINESLNSSPPTFLKRTVESVLVFNHLMNELEKQQNAAKVMENLIQQTLQRIEILKDLIRQETDENRMQQNNFEMEKLRKELQQYQQQLAAINQQIKAIETKYSSEIALGSAYNKYLNDVQQTMEKHLKPHMEYVSQATNSIMFDQNGSINQPLAKAIVEGLHLDADINSKEEVENLVEKMSDVFANASSCAADTDKILKMLTVEHDVEDKKTTDKFTDDDLASLLDDPDLAETTSAPKDPLPSPPTRADIEARKALFMCVNMVGQLNQKMNAIEHANIDPRMIKELEKQKVRESGGNPLSFLADIAHRNLKVHAAMRPEMQAHEEKLRAEIQDLVDKKLITAGFIAQHGELKNMGLHELREVYRAISPALVDIHQQLRDLKQQKDEVQVKVDSTLQQMNALEGRVIKSPISSITATNEAKEEVQKTPGKK